MGMSAVSAPSGSWVDVAALVVVAAFVFVGLVRGFWRQIVGLSVLAGSVLAAVALSPRAAELIRAKVWGSFPERAALLLAFVLILVAAAAAGSFVGHLVKQRLSKSRPAPYDRVLGGFLGGAKAAVLLFVLVLGSIYAFENGADTPGPVRSVITSRTGRIAGRTVEAVNPLLPERIAAGLRKVSAPLR